MGPYRSFWGLIRLDRELPGMLKGCPAASDQGWGQGTRAGARLGPTKISTEFDRIRQNSTEFDRIRQNFDRLSTDFRQTKNRGFAADISKKSVRQKSVESPSKVRQIPSNSVKVRQSPSKSVKVRLNSVSLPCPEPSPLLCALALALALGQLGCAFVALKAPYKDLMGPYKTSEGLIYGLMAPLSAL